MWLLGAVILATLAFANEQDAILRLQAFDNESSASPVSGTSTSVLPQSLPSPGPVVQRGTARHLHITSSSQGEPSSTKAEQSSSEESSLQLVPWDRDGKNALEVVGSTAGNATDDEVPHPTSNNIGDVSYFRMMTSGTNIHGKRQSEAAYVDRNGTVSNDCSSAPIYQIRNGSLVAIVEQKPYYYSTNPGVDIQLMVPSESQAGSINTTFTLGPQGTLLWYNPAFYNGAATFCSATNGSIYAIFQRNARPSNCLEVQLELFTVASCQGILATYQFPASTVVSTVISTAATATTTRPGTTVVTTQPGTTVTATPTFQLPPPSACDNQGMDYALFDNPYTTYTGAYSTYNPTYMKNGPTATATPKWTRVISSGNTSSAGGGFSFGSGCLPVAYSVRTIDGGCDRAFSMLLRGYIYVYMTGFWYFALHSVDDIAFIWVNGTARYGWDKNNADVRGTHNYDSSLRAGRNFSDPIWLEAGKYLPWRVAFGNALGNKEYGLTVTDPMGGGFVSTPDSTVRNPYVVRFACDRTIEGAGRFDQAWGTEG